MACAKCAWSDYHRALQVLDGKPFEVMTINDMAMHFLDKPITHAVSLHPEMLEPMRQIRIRTSRDQAYFTTHTHVSNNIYKVDFHWNSEFGGGTSTLLAVEIALFLGYEKLIICGTPLDNSPHYWEDDYKEKSNRCKFPESNSIDTWRSYFEQFPDNKEKVRVISGNLIDVCGQASKEWMKAEVSYAGSN